MKLESLQDLLIDQLRDLYSAERQLVKALPKMAKAAHNPMLKAGFEEHLEQTREHVERLEQCFEKLGVRARAKTCEAMEGLIEEGEDLIDSDAEDNVRDAGLICAAQKVEHYEMAGYGSVRTWAQEIGQNEVANLLQQTLDEEKQTNSKLNHIAEQMVNVHAAHA